MQSLEMAHLLEEKFDSFDGEKEARLATLMISFT